MYDATKEQQFSEVCLMLADLFEFYQRQGNGAVIGSILRQWANDPSWPLEKISALRASREQTPEKTGKL